MLICFVALYSVLLFLSSSSLLSAYSDVCMKMEPQVKHHKVTKDCLDCYYFNATSIRDKLDEFNSHFTKNDYDLISISETWCNESVLKGEILKQQQYNVFRRDRDLQVWDKKDGGGCLLAVSTSITAKRRKDLEDLSLEIVWVELKLSSAHSLFVGTVYMNYPNVALLNALENSFSKVLSCANPNDSIICFGDYNMPLLSWFIAPGSDHATVTNRTELSPNCVSSRFLEVIDSHDMQQFNAQNTCNDHVLDLVVGYNVTAKVDKEEKACSSTHDALHAVINVSNVQSTIEISREVYNFKRTDWLHVFQLLTYINWSSLLNYDSANIAMSQFYDIIYAVLRDAVPIVKVNQRKYPPWYDKELILLIKEKERHRKTYIKEGRNKMSNDFACFSSLRREIKAIQKLRLFEYVKELGFQMKENSKKFWSYVKSIKVMGGLPSVMFYKNKELSSMNDIVSKFNEFFTSNFQNDASVLPNCNLLNVSNFKLKTITEAQMKKKLHAVNKHSSCGYDNIPAMFISKCAEQLCYPLTVIFNLCILHGEYPSLLKHNNVIPICKPSKEKAFIESYRGISIQPVIAKVFESLIKDQLQPHIKRLIVDEQHGFQPKKSTFTNLACYNEFLTKAVEIANWKFIRSTQTSEKHSMLYPTIYYC